MSYVIKATVGVFGATAIRNYLENEEERQFVKFDLLLGYITRMIVNHRLTYLY